MDEDRPTIWDRFDWEYQGLMALMDSYIYDRAMDDRVVLVGRGSNFLLEGIPHALRVRLTAPIEQRVERVMRKDGVDRKNALRLIEKMDNDRASFIRANFHRDWYDLTAYDMVFNTAVQTFEEITDIVCNALQEKAGKLTLEAWEMLRGGCLRPGSRPTSPPAPGSRSRRSRCFSTASPSSFRGSFAGWRTCRRSARS